MRFLFFGVAEQRSSIVVAGTDHAVRMTAIIVTYNNAEEVRASLDALLGQQVDGGLEIVVVDNASTDGTPDVLRDYADRVVLSLRSTNVGYAEGNNEGLALSSGRLVALINPDCVVAPGCLEELGRHLEQSPGVGMSAALLHNLDGSLQLFARRSLGLRSTVMAFTHLGQQADRRLLRARYEQHRRYAESWPPTAPMSVDCPAAACVVLWRHLTQPQLFDPRFPLLFNDADLDRRLTAKGYALQVVPTAQAAHGYGTSLRRVTRSRMRAERVAALRRFVSSEWGAVRLTALWAALVLDCLLLLPFCLRGRRRALNRDHVRGTLGGLGLPGGRAPWLTVVGGPGARLRAVVRRVRSRPRVLLRRSSRRLRRRWFLWRLRCAAWLVRSTVDVDIAPTADVARSVRLEIKPRRKTSVRLGPYASVQHGVVLRLGGALDIGAFCEVRYRSCLNVNGTLHLVGRNQIGLGSVISADVEQVWEWGAACSDHVTVVDTYHGHDGSPVHVFEQGLPAKAIRIGAGTLLGAKSSVMPGVTIGSGAIVGTSSVVTRDLPAGCVAMGIPARPREVPPSPALSQKTKPARRAPSTKGRP